MPRVEAQLAHRSTRILHVGGPGYPIDEGIEDRPAILFVEGERTDALERPRVAVVGTRAATPQGLADARDLGAALARAGCVVVSGLAIGIDGAAHEGALDAGGAVIGVVATGLDVVYPRRHRTLYGRVREHGLLVGRAAVRHGPRPGRFPVRNRIIAALSDVTIVVEATQRGGARITAQHALDYGRGGARGSRLPPEPGRARVQRAPRRRRPAAPRPGGRRRRARPQPGRAPSPVTRRGRR